MLELIVCVTFALVIMILTKNSMSLYNNVEVYKERNKKLNKEVKALDAECMKLSNEADSLLEELFICRADRPDNERCGCHE